MLAATWDALAYRPGPTSYNAILAYAADLGWGLKRDLTDEQYIAGEDLMERNPALKTSIFVKGGPIVLPAWLSPPPGIVWGTEGT